MPNDFVQTWPANRPIGSFPTNGSGGNPGVSNAGPGSRFFSIDPAATVGVGFDFPLPPGVKSFRLSGSAGGGAGGAKTTGTVGGKGGGGGCFGAGNFGGGLLVGVGGVSITIGAAGRFGDTSEGNGRTVSIAVTPSADLAMQIPGGYGGSSSNFGDFPGQGGGINPDYPLVVMDGATSILNANGSNGSAGTTGKGGAGGRANGILGGGSVAGTTSKTGAVGSPYAAGGSAAGVVDAASVGGDGAVGWVRISWPSPEG
jgi:hypothetical protein